MKRKYYPNNWDEIQKAPDDYFPSMPFEEFEDWKVFGYVLPSPVFGIIRSESKDKVEEYTYKSEYQAKERVKKELAKNKRITLCTMEGVWHIKPYPLEFNNP